MKAITLHAPWGTLLHTRSVSHGIPNGLTPQRDFGRACEGPFVKRFETRSWPCPPSIVGTRVAFHQAKKYPPAHWKAGDYRIRGYGRTGYALEGPGLTPFRSTPRLEGCFPPFGCIVASGVITRSLPIVDCNDMEHNGQHRLLRVRENELWITAKSGPPRDITDQLPYGDFTPGRWAWELSDVAAATDRCPWCAGQGTLDLDAFGFERCAVCRGAGKCEPISATGKQRWWEWRP